MKRRKPCSSDTASHDDEISGDGSCTERKSTLADLLEGALPTAIWPWLFAREVTRLRRVSVAVARTAQEIEATTGRRLDTRPTYSVYVSTEDTDPKDCVSGAVLIHASSGPFHHSTIFFPGCTGSTWQSFVYKRNEEMTPELLWRSIWGSHPEKAHTCMWACGERSSEEYPAWLSAGRAVRGYLAQGDLVRCQGAVEWPQGTNNAVGAVQDSHDRSRWALRSAFGKWDDWALELWRGETLRHRVYHERPVGSTPMALLHRALRQLLGGAPGEDSDEADEDGRLTPRPRRWHGIPGSDTWDRQA
jgi:hypothetical protein